MKTMRTVALIVILFTAAAMNSGPAEAGGHGHGGHGHVAVYGGFGWGSPWYGGWGSPWYGGWGSPWYGGWGYPWYAGWGPYYPPPGYPYSEPPRWFAAVDTDVSPERARVFLDGQEIGEADNFDGFPDYLWVSPGRHTIEFRANGYRTLRINLSARSAMYYEIERTLTGFAPGETDGRPETENMPSGGEGGAPAEGNEQAPPSPYGPPSGAQGGEPPSDEGPAPPPPAARGNAGGGTATVLFRIRPDDAAVYVDGKLIGAGAGLPEGGSIKLPGGRHQIEIVRPGYVAYSTPVHLRDGETRTLTIELDPEPGER